MIPFSPASRRWCVAAFAVAMPPLGSCAGPAQFSQTLHTENSLRRLHAATQDAVECRAAVARNPRYQILDERMPLTDIGAASLSQMADPKLATKDEISALSAWIADMNACRERLLRVTDTAIPSLGPIFEASWTADEAVFVKLAHHKMTWGEVVLNLKTNTTKLRADIISRADQIAAELEKQEQAQINRRTAIIASAIGKLP